MLNGSFPADGETLAYSLYAPLREPREVALSLHGAGPAGRERIGYLAEHLASAGSSLFCFDFSGHGESSGHLAESSLSRRSLQAITALQVMEKPPTLLIGTSMGGHIASSVLTAAAPKFLVLFCPALYGDDSLDRPFDRRFSDSIRKPASFEHSSLRRDLGRYAGKSLLIIGEDDRIIPPRVVEIYGQELRKEGQFTLLRLPGAPHNLHGWAQQSPENRLAILRAVDQLLGG
jgi:pimeloyl-ACP methyl ester carboxylesterase